MDIFKRIIHDLHERQAAADSRQLPTPSCIREKSATERAVSYRPANWGILFCCHNKSYFEICGQCHRDRKRAKMEYEAFLNRHSLNA